MNALNITKRSLVVVCIATALVVTLAVIVLDRYAAYPYSTHMTVIVDVPSVSEVKDAWYTTNDFVMEQCVRSDVWDLSKFEKMTSITTSRYAVNVTASMKRSVVFGRNRGMLWRGKILILIEAGGVNDAYLIDHVPNRGAITVAKEHRIVSDVKVTESQQ